MWFAALLPSKPETLLTISSHLIPEVTEGSGVPREAMIGSYVCAVSFHITQRASQMILGLGWWLPRGAKLGFLAFLANAETEFDIGRILFVIRVPPFLKRPCWGLVYTNSGLWMGLHKWVNLRMLLGSCNHSVACREVGKFSMILASSYCGILIYRKDLCSKT